MPTARALLPHVEPTDDLLVYRVRSRSRERWHRVDLEMNYGRGKCNCEAYSFGADGDCYHLQQARKYLICAMVLKMKEQQ